MGAGLAPPLICFWRQDAVSKSPRQTRQSRRKAERQAASPTAEKAFDIDYIPTRTELEDAGIRVLVTVPMERTAPSESFWNFFAIAGHGFGFVPSPYGRVDVQRNTFGKLVAATYPEYTHLCMLDLDHAHPHDVVERLARHVIADPTKKVIGGINFRRGAPYDPCIFIPDSTGKWRPPMKWGKGVYQVAGIGFGCILIDATIFKEVEGPWFGYTYQHFDEEVYPSEDIWFSTLMEKHGIPIYVDTTTTSPHLTAVTIDEASFRSFVAQHRDIINVIKNDEEVAPDSAPKSFLKKG